MASDRLPIQMHGFPMSTTTQVALIAGLESALTIEMKNVVLFQGQHKNPDYIASFNIFGRIPTIVDPNRENFQLFESRAIMKYFALSYPKESDPLVPSAMLYRVHMEQIVSVEFSYFTPNINKIIGTIIGNAMGFNAIDESVIESHIKNPDFITSLSFLEKLLAENVDNKASKYLLGAQGLTFTLADIVFIPFVFWYEKSYSLKPEILSKYPHGNFFSNMESYPNLTLWWTEVKQRPSVQFVMKMSDETFDIALRNNGKSVDKESYPEFVKYSL